MSTSNSFIKIVITGGPGAGKTSALEYIRSHFKKRGYTVLVLSEVATDLITSGIAPWTCENAAEYQLFQTRMQMAKEAVFEAAAKSMAKRQAAQQYKHVHNAETHAKPAPAKPLLIVCDRGTLDSKSYVTDEEFAAIIHTLDTTEQTLLNNYDAIFHLVTAAQGAEKFYTLKNNAARVETIEEARALDARLMSVWAKHPYQRIIGNEGTFEEKLTCLLKEIERFLASF